MRRAIAGAESSLGDKIEMDDFVLLGLIGIIFFLLGPIGFFLTLGARSRLKNVEAQLAALLARAPLEEREKRQAPSSYEQAPSSREIVETPPVAPPPTPRPEAESAAEAMEQIRLALMKVDSTPASPLPDAPEEAAEETSPPAPIATPPKETLPLPAAPKGRKIGIEERLGAHWAVIVGGVALAFGALLLVK
jgi:uncharacterized membrane protein